MKVLNVEFDWKPLNVLIVGDKPSTYNKSPEVPFVGTPSYKRLCSWIAVLDLDINKVRLVNSDSSAYIYAYDKVIFLGKDAARQFKHFDFVTGRTKIIDHPSPRNRNFNNPRYERKMLKELKE